MRSHPASVGSAWGALLLAFALLLSVRSAVAAVEPALASKENGVRIQSSTCPHPLVEEVQHLARVELNSAGMPEGADAPRVVLTCAERVVLIRAVLGPVDDTRQLDLDQTDDTLRARVIALAIAELVRDTANRAARPTPSPPPLPEPEPEPAPAAATPAPPPLPANSQDRLVLFGKLSNFGRNFEPLYGGGLAFSHDVGRFALGLGPTLVASSNDRALGAVHALAADLSLRLALRFPSRILPSEVGVGHSLGLAHLKGSSDLPDANASRVSGVWAGPFLFAGLEAKLAEPFFLHLALEFGVVTVPVRGYVARGSDIGMSGAWGGLSLGLGLNL